MATYEQDSKSQSASKSASGEVLKREPTHDQAREARKFQEERAGVGPTDRSNQDQNEEQTQQTEEPAKGNRR